MEEEWNWKFYEGQKLWGEKNIEREKTEEMRMWTWRERKRRDDYGVYVETASWELFDGAC